MKLIVITHPDMLPDEAAIINQLFANGLARLHVRKPGGTEVELRALLTQIDPHYRDRIALHQHHVLAELFGISGLHFTESNRLVQAEQHFKALKNGGFTISTSLHDPADLEKLSHRFDYAFLGPVFDSISKKGYRSLLAADFKFEKHGFPGEVLAIGGIHTGNLKSAFSIGFDGAAALGTIWQNPENAVAQFRHLASLLSSFQQSSSQQSAFQQSSLIPGLKPGAMDLNSDFKAIAIHCPRFQPGIEIRRWRLMQRLRLI